ncbi:mechanosensitive ion channel family protein [Synechococcus sp. CCY 9618]|uniref:mechanosensitive ion channel family protein n=1 Tax=Synechococcus sp. CCY 9618 TaxID=2815602 RepID=UPI001C24BF17|nr:mechanosensitive ion channel family protein [Synechococcus sp. CCY 9618]
MALLQTWIVALVAVAGLLVLARVCRRRKLPGMPMRLPLAAVLTWAVLSSLPLQALPDGYRVWLGLTDDLLLTYAAILMALWAALEVPAHLGLWRPPPQLLMQLLTLGSGAMATVVVVRQSARLDLVGLVTTSAVLTAVIGLAAQESLKDLFSGLELQLGDDFVEGDFLEVDEGVRGVVVRLTWRDTMLRNMDGHLVVVPNSLVTEKVLRNLGRSGAVSNRFSVGLDYDLPPAQAKALLEKVVLQHPRVLREPAPRIRVREFQDSSIAYELQVWQKELGDGAIGDLRSDLLEHIWYALAREGQSIPFPVREIQPRRSRDRPPQADRPSPQLCCQALSSVGIFADLSGEQLETLVEGSHLVSYGPGEAVVQEGAEGRSMFHLLRGTVEILKEVQPGHTVAVRQLGPGEVFGEMTLFLDAPRSATVRATEECLLLKVDRDSIKGLLGENPDLLERFAALVEERQAELKSLDREQQTERSNALLDTMKRLFFAFKGV